MDCVAGPSGAEGRFKGRNSSLSVNFARRVSDKQRMRNRIVHDPWYFHFNQDGSTTGYRLESSAVKTVVRKLIKQDHERNWRRSFRTLKALCLQLTNLVAPWYQESAALSALSVNPSGNACETTLTPLSGFRAQLLSIKCEQCGRRGRYIIAQAHAT